MVSKNIAYIEKLDHLRLLAAVTVLLFHSKLLIGSQAAFDDPFYIPLIEQGHTGVPLFMIISGMILGLIAADREIIISRFYLNRVLRIYPLFLFVITLGYFSTSDPRPTSTGVDYLLSLLPIANLYRLNFGAFGGHLWSIAVELQFYLIFPFLLLFCRKYGRWYPLALICFFIVLRMLVFTLNGTVHHMAYFSLFGNLELFLTGMLLANIYRARPVESRGWLRHPAAMAVAFVLINVLIYVVFLRPSFFNVGPEPFSSSRNWIYWPTVQAAFWGGFVLLYLRSSLELPWSDHLARLGSYSYSIYVWHILVIMLMQKTGWVNYLSPYTGGLFVVLPLTLLLAAASYHLIEMPFLQMRVRYLKERAEKPAD